MPRQLRDPSLEPGQREPAPGRLRLVQAFVNTRNRELEADELSAPAALAEWLAEAGLLAAHEELDKRDLNEALELREALRGLLLSHNGEALDQDAVSAVDRLARDCHLRVEVGRDGTVELAPASMGIRAAWARLLGIVQEAARDGSWTRLKACRDDVCQWAFYDHSRNRSGHWCTMEICGARSKMRRYRARQRTREDVGDELRSSAVRSARD